MIPTRIVPAVLTLLLTSSVCFLSGAHADETPKLPAAEMNEKEKAFSDKMHGSVLVGTFTIDGKPLVPKAERYEIDSATKNKGNSWTVVARVKYGKFDVKVPIFLKVDWAGDTPVMSLTDLTIPGLGTFTSRTMFYGDRYVGTWQHGKVGGHMFGHLEKQKPKTP